jgi:hypothetical protein
MLTHTHIGGFRFRSPFSSTNFKIPLSLAQVNPDELCVLKINPRNGWFQIRKRKKHNQPFIEKCSQEVIWSNE